MADERPMHEQLMDGAPIVPPELYEEFSRSVKRERQIADECIAKGMSVSATLEEVGRVSRLEFPGLQEKLDKLLGRNRNPE